MFYQIFLSPQVKRWAIITYKHGIYEFLHELLNDVRLRILENEEILGNIINFIEWWASPQFPCFPVFPVFLLPQVKWCAIKHGIYKLPHDYPNDLRLKTLGNEEIL